MEREWRGRGGRTALLADLGENLALVKLAKLGGLDLDGNTDKALAESILGRCIDHLCFDLGSVGAPVDEEQFVAHRAVRLVVRKVKHGITAVSLLGGGVRGWVRVRRWVWCGVVCGHTF